MIDTLLTGVDRMIYEFESKSLNIGEVMIELDFDTWENLRVHFNGILRYSSGMRGPVEPPDLIYRERVRFRAIRNRMIPVYIR